MDPGLSPFQPGLPVPVECFVGRQDEIERLSDGQGQQPGQIDGWVYCWRAGHWQRLPGALFAVAVGGKAPWRVVMFSWAVRKTLMG